jgi:uncharacterized protein YkwD
MVNYIDENVVSVNYINSAYCQKKILKRNWENIGESLFT